jgi:uncharacterized PurR-regulated membrane protein YhhQ (DUF165 family)
MGGLAAAFAFTWFGMVIAISFVETPLKFRAPGITVPLGLRIGRLVFKVLNIAVRRPGSISATSASK